MNPQPCGMPWLPYRPAGSSFDAATSKSSATALSIRCLASAGWQGRMIVSSAGTSPSAAAASPGAIFAKSAAVNGTCATSSPQYTAKAGSSSSV